MKKLSDDLESIKDLLTCVKSSIKQKDIREAIMRINLTIKSLYKLENKQQYELSIKDFQEFVEKYNTYSKIENVTKIFIKIENNHLKFEIF